MSRIDVWNRKRCNTYLTNQISAQFVAEKTFTPVIILQVLNKSVLHEQLAKLYSIIMLGKVGLCPLRWFIYITVSRYRSSICVLNSVNILLSYITFLYKLFFFLLYLIWTVRFAIGIVMCSKSYSRFFVHLICVDYINGMQ